MRDRGSALVEALIVAAAAVLLIGQSLVGAGRVASAAEAAAAAAQSAVAASMRLGADAEAIANSGAPPGSTVEVLAEGDRLEVVVRTTVSVVGPVSITVSGRAAATLSIYRSRR